MNMKKKKTDFESVIKSVIKKSEKERKTYCLVQYHRKDKKLIPLCIELEKDAVKIGKTYYFADTKRIWELKVKIGKQFYTLPILDVYEGITISYTPYEEIETKEFSELFQDVISLHI